ncbi:hypothetical protein [Glutamicibacter creatinolyticus]|uniref:hypothetical protein n=1 Tax=Glutamicibacter creatinolyticus TaxID=162496 RepID=UPI0032172520
MQGVLRVNGRPAKIRLRVKVRGLPAGVSVDVTDLMLQPGAAVSGWLPHTTELPWSAGMTFLNTSPGGDLVFWDDIEGKPVVFPPETHTHLWKDIAGKPTEFPPTAHSHGAGEIKSGVFDPARIPVLGTNHLIDESVTPAKLSPETKQALSPSDTGWVSLTLNQGYTARAGTTYTPAARRIGGAIFIRGQVDRVNSPAASSGGVVLTLPKELAPGYEVQIPLKAGGEPSNSWIRPNGDLYLVASDTSKGVRYQVLDVVFADAG